VKPFVREVVYYKHYYLDFYKEQTDSVRLKLNWTLSLIATQERVPVKFFKHLEGTDGIYEIRVEVGNNIYRVFSFFDHGQLIVLINGFQKKTQKTPRQEILLATKIKKEYFDEKGKK
jgi:phage-related protein